MMPNPSLQPTCYSWDNASPGSTQFEGAASLKELLALMHNDDANYG